MVKNEETQLAYLSAMWLGSWREVLSIICRTALDRGQRRFRDCCKVYWRWTSCLLRPQYLCVYTGLRCCRGTVNLTRILCRQDKQLSQFDLSQLSLALFLNSKHMSHIFTFLLLFNSNWTKQATIMLLHLFHYQFWALSFDGNWG